MSGGTGTRMGSAKPKQLLEIGGKPILVHTINAFMKSGLIDAYVICAPAAYLPETRAVVGSHIALDERFHFVAGGTSRNASVYNGCRYIRETWPLLKDDIILTHDAVRPFIDERIIAENIRLARLYGSANTVIPCVDTILESHDGAFLSGVPDRSVLYRVQTPQSFRFSLLWDILSCADSDELNRYTDTAGLVAAHGEKVALVLGDERNIKITTPFDLSVASVICENNAAADTR